MSWTVKRLYLILIALVLWGDTNGFGVWNRSSVVHWQAGHSDTIRNPNSQLSTRVQPFKLLARKSAIGNVGGGNSSSALLTSEGQPVQHDSSFAQSSGGATHDKFVLHSQSQATLTGKNELTSQPSSLHWFEFFKPEKNGALLSQPQSAATTNQAYRSHTQSSYQPSTTTHVLSAQPIFSQAQSSGGYKLYQDPTSGRPLTSLGQSIPSSWQSAVFTGQVSGIQAQLSGGFMHQAPTSGRPLTSQGQSIPSSWQSAVSIGQVSGIQTQTSYQPNNTTRGFAGQSAYTSQDQSSGGFMHQVPTSGRPLTSLGQNIPSSWQPAVSTGQVSLIQAQPSGGYMHQAQTSGRPLTSQGQSIPSSWQSALSTGQVSGIQTQTSYQPNTTQGFAGQSASTSQDQSSGGYMHQAPTSGRLLTSLGQSIPSSWQSALSTGQVSGSYQPAGQPASTSLAQSLGASDPSQTSGRYILQGLMTPSISVVSGIQTQVSNQPSSTTHVLPGQSASTPQLQCSGSSLDQQHASSRYNSLSPSIHSSTQSLVNQNQVSASETTQISTGQSSLAPVLFSNGAETSQNAKWYAILQPQNIPTSFQFVGTANSEFQSQLSHQPSSLAHVLAGQTAFASHPHFMGASALYQGLPSGRYLTSLDQSMPSSRPTNQMSEIQTQ